MLYLKLFEDFNLSQSDLKNLENSHNIYLKNFNKRFEYKKFTDTNSKVVLDTLINDCKPFLDELKTKKQYPIFRGVDSYNTIIDKRTVRKDRVPKDMNDEISAFLDEMFLDILGVKLRSSGVFTTKIEAIAGDYGTSYMFFPIGKYSYYANPDVPDLYSKTSNMFLKDTDLEYEWKDSGMYYYNGKEYHNTKYYSLNLIKNDYPDKFQDVDYYDMHKNQDIIDNLKWEHKYTLDEFIKLRNESENNKLAEIIEGYQKNKMENLYLQEITFMCDEYYIVDKAFYGVICEYLEKNN